MLKQLGFVIDLHKCIGCRGCEMACQNQHQIGGVHRRRVIKLAEEEQSTLSFLSMTCNHCINPACVGVCPQNCFRKRRDGIVLHNSSNCNGCQSCVGACPYRALKLIESIKKVDKCNLCADRLEEGLPPACVEGCVPGAISLMEISRLDPEIYHRALPGMGIVSITNPAVRFTLPKQTKTYWRLIERSE